jgi:glycosyltransferase involved in cell wall biosynthesis
MDAQVLDRCWDGTDDPGRPWAFLVSVPVVLDDLPARLGSADYSYGFVLQALRPVLERIGSVRMVPRPECSLISEAARAAAEGFRPVHLSLSPPQRTYLTPAVPTVLFPFWEFPRIPDRDFGHDTRQNWARTCRSANLILTACNLTAEAFRGAVVDVPRARVPVPVPPDAFQVADWDPRHAWSLTCRHVAWGGPPALSAQRDAEAVAQLHDALPLRGVARIERGLRRRYHRYVRPYLSERAALRIRRAKNALLRKVDAPPPPRIPAQPLTLSGLVYTSIFNLGDPRKNPRDLLSAFLVAFRDRADATLVLKLAASPTTELHELRRIEALYRSLGLEHRCRVVVLVDYLSEADLDQLYRATTYYVNTSHAEGACLPLQRALACGRPGIAPAHTSMADYMDDRVGFVVASHPEPAPWPHDPELRCETTWHRLVWSDLHDQLRRSAAVAGSGSGTYHNLARAARDRMARYASQEAAVEALQRGLSRMRPARLGALDWAA